jgi:hypothetical protein
LNCFCRASQQEASAHRYRSECAHGSYTATICAQSYELTTSFWNALLTIDIRFQKAVQIYLRKLTQKAVQRNSKMVQIPVFVMQLSQEPRINRLLDYPLQIQR